MTADATFRRWVRIGFAVLLVASAGTVAASYMEATDRRALETNVAEQAEKPFAERDPLVAPRENMTVITGQASPFADSKAIYAFAPDGRLRYFNDSAMYGNVEPVPGTTATVLYPPGERLSKDECPGTVKCSRQYLAHANLTTGEVTRFHDHMTPHHQSSNWHDVTRVSATEYLIADIAYDRVYIVNVSSGTVEWEWDAQANYSLSGGGEWPRDWTHVNDVELLPDGRVMASLRNQDQVVFIDRETGLQENWTLGSEDDYSTLYEQHNPDYIPESQGGPAVVVADSENNRVVEYQRRNGSWVQTWAWSDDRLQWPRDADRLPNGHTLITDSHGNRVFEVDRQGDIVWSVEVTNPYNAERLGTGAESRNGPSAVRANLTTHTSGGTPSVGETDGSGDRSLRERVSDEFSKLRNGLNFVLPPWMDFGDVAALAASICALVAWVAVELRWRGFWVAVRNPIRWGRE